jgi:hypothetical protein
MYCYVHNEMYSVQRNRLMQEPQAYSLHERMSEKGRPFSAQEGREEVRLS